MSVSIIHQ